ncbi:TauD/TfdA family dioxygenase [Ensifer sp. NPDC090286]|uniref:TauD/TfdA family dioxygenase n=1 Tax=Ensifer sp. NPDC090286 TaxID=3363991 RepID=UPI003839D328
MVIEDLRENGWLILSRHSDSEKFSMLTRQIENDAPLMRDVEITSAAAKGQLRASRKQFDFHTDGVFWKIPPRWMCIEVLRADAGGALHVVDLRPLALSLGAIGPVFFGNENAGCVARAADDRDGNWILRYRRDYMHAVDGTEPAHWESAHTAVANHVQAQAHRVGELQPNECLFLDNWSFAHCREAFSGERVIRRMWFGGIAA